MTIDVIELLEKNINDKLEELATEPDEKAKTARLRELNVLLTHYKNLTEVENNKSKAERESATKVRELDIKQMEAEIKKMTAETERNAAEAKQSIDKDTIDVKQQEIDLKTKEIELKSKEIDNAKYAAEEEAVLRSEAMTLERKAHKIQMLMEAAKVITNIGLFAMGCRTSNYQFLTGLQFEETGVFRSTTMRKVPDVLKMYKKI